VQPDLTSANLRGADLSGMDLAGVSLSLANLKKADLAGANLTDANLAGADLEEAILAGATLDGAVMAGTQLARAVLAGASLRKTNLAGANLTGGTNLSGANFEEANLAGAKLAGANLAGANFSNAILAGADFRDADLTGANLTNAVTSGAKFDGANLAGAIVRSHRSVPPSRHEPAEVDPQSDMDETAAPFTAPAEDDRDARLAALLAEDEPEPPLPPEAVADPFPEPELEAFLESEFEVTPEPAPEAIPEPELEAPPEPELEAFLESEFEVPPEPAPEAIPEPELEAPPEPEPEAPPEPEFEVAPEPEPAAAPAPSMEMPPPDEPIDDRVLTYDTRDMAILALYSVQIGRKTPHERKLLVDLLTQYNRNVFPVDVRVPMVATGNAIIAGFDNPTNALRCGTIYIDMLREMNVESYVAVNWGKATAVIDEDGSAHDDLIVNSISPTARLMPVASRGEVLILEELYAHPLTQRDMFTFEHVTRTWKAMSDPGGRGVDVPCYSVRRNAS